MISLPCEGTTNRPLDVIRAKAMLLQQKQQRQETSSSLAVIIEGHGLLERPAADDALACSSSLSSDHGCPGSSERPVPPGSGDRRPVRSSSQLHLYRRGFCQVSRQGGRWPAEGGLVGGVVQNLGVVQNRPVLGHTGA